MCGRTACTLAPADLCRACIYRDRSGVKKTPVWKNASDGKPYYPSYNLAPTSYTPVLLSSKHYGSDFTKATERIVQPMKWGMIPSWHKGPSPKVEYETNNCRAEGMLQKRTYKVPLEKGQRCVILADGFYEWKRKDGAKQPYFIYFPQTDSSVSEIVLSKAKTEAHGLDAVVKDEPSDISNCALVPALESSPQKISCEQSALKVNLSEMKSKELLEDKWNSEECETKKLLTMAGVFDVWRPPDGSSPIYSYSVITVESSPAVSWIHHRMPAILTEREVDDWLNFGEIPLSKAVSLIRPTENIQLHPVSSTVNYVRNNSADCVEPIDLQKKKPENKLMANWLSKSKEKNDECGTAVKHSPVKSSQSKKSKNEPTLMMKWLVKSEKKDNTEEPPAKKHKNS